MTPEQFCYWLNGFGELSPDAPTAEQWKAIKEHLALVFTKVTPIAPGQWVQDFPKYIQQDPMRDAQAIPGPRLPGMPAVTC